MNRYNGYTKCIESSGFGKTYLNDYLDDFKKTFQFSKDFDKKSIAEKQAIINKTAVYNLPLLKKFHAYQSLKIKKTPEENKNKIYKYFGLNWWDLATNGTFDKILPKNELKFKEILTDRNIAGILLINVSADTILVENKNNGDIYTIKSNEYSYYNRDKQNELYAYRENNKKQKLIINQINIGYVCYILLGIEDLINKKNNIIKTPLYTDFYIGSGIINPELYSNTIGLNSFLKQIKFENNKIIDDADESFQTFVVYLEDLWNENKANIDNNTNITNSIPLQIHWIWLSKEPYDYNESPETSVTKFSKFMETWVIRNTNCKFNVWTNSKNIELPDSIKDKITIKNINDIKKLILKLDKKYHNTIKKLIFEHKNVGIRSDTLRQCILYLEGGLYCDINDMECLMPLEPFMNKYEFICGLEPMLYTNNAIIGSIKGHIINKRFIEYIHTNTNSIFKEYYDNMEKTELDNWVVSWTGPVAFSSILFGCLDDYFNEKNDGLKNTIVFPSKFLYSNYEIKNNPIYWLSPITLTAHYDTRTFL